MCQDQLDLLPDPRIAERSARTAADDAEQHAIDADTVSHNADRPQAARSTEIYAARALNAAHRARVAADDAGTVTARRSAARAAEAYATTAWTAEAAAAYACDTCRDTVARQLEREADAAGRRYPYPSLLEMAVRDRMKADRTARCERHATT